MSARVLKQDINRQKVKKNAIYQHKPQHANFRGDPLDETTKQQLNGGKRDAELGHVSAFG